MNIKIEFNKNKDKVFHIDNLHGYIEISQKSEKDPTIFLIAIGGLTPNKLHGFHIHEKPVQDLNDLYKSCDSCGGHFNPTNKNHGSILNMDNGENRHVGDLINNIKADNKGNCIIEFSDDKACIFPTVNKNYTIVGKSIVIHENTDDLGREGLPKDIPYLITNNEIHGSKRVLNKSEQYKSRKKRESSKINGNAGKRIACANIL